MKTYTIVTAVGTEEVKADAFILDENENLSLVAQGGETVAAFSRGAWVSIVKEDD